MTAQHHLTLYSMWASSCAQRLWIALHYKGLEYDLIPVDLVKDEHLGSTYGENISAHKTVPVLKVVPTGSSPSDSPLFLRQSLTALHWLEDAYPARPSLLPAWQTDPLKRAHVEDLVNLMAVDIQPVTNRRVALRAEAMGATYEQWVSETCAGGFDSYERLVAKSAGKYSVGDEITLADVVLYAQVDLAVGAAKMPIDAYPTVSRICDNLKQHPSFAQAEKRKQPDAPAQRAAAAKS
ncbi:Glutathione S-transferase [Ceraceosorus bombacis]|uniref:Glutathione S-transferase n=1 Tax=Ceraceosorus bombacis TaxID=401625 RepID=A0A0P1B9S1_9BASI|nr:Glutathione S-transferase [Ceraceosorus bombacis]